MTTHSPIRSSPRPRQTAWQPIWEIIRFELQESFRTRFLPLAFTFFLLVGLLSFLVNGSDLPVFTFMREGLGGATKPGELVPYANAPLKIMENIGSATILLVLLIIGIFADRATKDFTSNIDGLLFTSPLKEWQFVTGRFLASFLISLLISLGVAVGMGVGLLFPWLDLNRVGPINLLSYVQPYLYLVIPNILIFGLFSFAIGLLTHRTLASYLGFLGIWVFSGILDSLLSLLQFDPFFNVLTNSIGTNTIAYAVRFWTKVQQNTLNVPFAPVIWLSRLFYLVLGAAFFAWVWQRFSFSGTASSSNSRFEKGLDWVERRLTFWKASQKSGSEPAAENLKIGAVPLQPSAQQPTQESTQQPIAHLHYGTGAQFRHVWRIARMELKRLMPNPLLIAILAIATVMLVVGLITSIVNSPGQHMLPSTDIVVELVNTVVKLLVPLLIIFLAGDLIWREREVKIDPLSDPLPVRSWAVVAGKLLALGLILVVTLVLLVIGGVIAQTLNSYPYYDLGAYGVSLFTVTLVDLLLISVMAITIQVLVNQKFLGYFLSAAVILVLGFADRSPGFKSFRLLQYGYKPSFYYGDLNGFGRMLEPVRWFQSYWLAIALLLICISVLFWVRGIDTHPKARWRIARQRFTRPMQIVMGLSAIAALCLGGWIFYNTHLLNAGSSRAEITDQAVAYEKAYGRLIDAQPKITAIDLQGDLYPDEDSRFSLRGTYTLENKTQNPIETILLNVPNGIQVNQITVNGASGNAAVKHPVVQGYEFTLASPLQPGTSTKATFDFLIQPQTGFTGEAPDILANTLVENGTSAITNYYLPIVGFFDRPRLKDNPRREAAGLPRLDPAAEAARLNQRNTNGADADRVLYSATLSTAPDQIAITSGEQVRAWTESGRRYFQYRSQVPIENQIPILSGRYEVLKDEWQGIPIEVYYHKGHDRNLQRIVRGAQQSLDYATQNFSPYPHKVLRFVEIPYFAEAVSYPSTIKAGERSMFMFRVNDDDPNMVDESFRIAAHETAHQWWGQQLLQSPTPGTKLLSESLAEYTANQVYGKEYGQQKLGIALRRNLENYLQNRNKSDVPLVEAEENHLVYQKGALAMFAMQDYLGEETVNRALAKLLDNYRNAPPYASAQDLVIYLREVTPEKYQYLITDLFQTVTLYNNRAESATFTQRADGKYDVTLKLNTAKVRSDKNGNETPADMKDEEIDVGVYDTTGKLVYLKKHPFKTGETQLTITIEQLPQRAGIDPLNKLIDKTPNDNVTNMSQAA
ncbi:ABC transporter permease/M1 family aminopeptidase [Leptolyngbya ohadii]|uniref:ABC transporter permease/M1 family aminopeptidase n=1 Tax=Leptolyngbya ohadii TaxID=1962290 RepID=UPI000B5A1049|nr:M1 family aminopeptidase [Leptolyngbya ohadii]